MGSSAAAGPRARLDVTTWTYHREPPSAVDADLDRQADRWFTVARAVQWITAAILVVSVAPLVFGRVGLSPLSRLVVCAVAIGFTVLTALWHQSLRARTGAPVIAALEEIIEPTAPAVAADVATFNQILGPGARTDFSHLNRGALRAARRSSRSALRKLRILGRHITTHCELAAQAERRGWNGLRDKHCRKVLMFCGAIVGQRDENGS